MKPIKSILIANRSEIAIRVIRSANELGMRSIGIYSNEDRLALHRFKADECYLVGKGKKPVSAYLDIPDIIRIAKKAKADAIHPGYGFLSENPEFVEACDNAGLIFIGPKASVMRALGNKVAARALAQKVGVPVMPATSALPQDFNQCKKLAQEIGLPIMIKASWGGGGRGMRVVKNINELADAIEVARREAKSAFGNDEVYFEKLVEKARHVEVQILGDAHGNIIHVFERDCTVQRRHQKVVERAPAPYLNDEQRTELCAMAVKIAKGINYTHAGTVEFLMDTLTNKFYFIEVNPRIQVEHTVTEEVTGIDIVKAQICISEGGKIGENDFLPAQDKIHLQAHAIQCRVTTENPKKNLTPDYGRLSAYRSPGGAGIRLDGGTAYGGAIITPFYDSLLVKITTRGHTPDEAIRRMSRSLREFYVRGVSTNVAFLENVVSHQRFRLGDYTTTFIDSTPELFDINYHDDKAGKILQFIGEVMVNGNPEMKGRKAPENLNKPQYPSINLDEHQPIRAGSRDLLKKIGAQAFSQWMLTQKQTLLTDTTMRDAHQSLFATRMRTFDMIEIAPYYAQLLPELFSIECWGGATFDVALRFLKECPWQRLQKIRHAIPNVLLQMLLRASNAVGYTNYPDNVVSHFVKTSAENGIDLFRVFDSLNWVENMRVAIDAVIESGALCEGTICYTSDLFDQSRPKYNLQYYIKMAKELEKAGAHIIGIKDMAGVCRAHAAKTLVSALKNEVALPIHFHTHDTSGASTASVLAAVSAGANAVDGAMDSMSGLTSQPSLGAIIAGLENTERACALNFEQIAPISRYWEGVREFYSPFEANIRAGTSDVYRHEMPGGQYTNLREQARALGLSKQWNEVAQAYADANKLFGDIIKVTPSSKVVGDMALFMVANQISSQEILEKNSEINFPESVVSMMKGELGYPADGFPKDIQDKVLKGQSPIIGRAAQYLPAIDLSDERLKVEKELGHKISECDFASYLMYPKVFSDFDKHRQKYSDVAVLPTPVFFYGLQDKDEMTIDLEVGKHTVVRVTGRLDDEAEEESTIYFESDGHPRPLKIANILTSEQTKSAKSIIQKAEEGNINHIPAPMPGMISQLPIKVGDKVAKGQILLSIEAMKMETIITAEREAKIAKILIRSGSQVEPKDLLIVLE